VELTGLSSLELVEQLREELDSFLDVFGDGLLVLEE